MNFFDEVYFGNTIHMDVQQAINLALLRRFREEGITFAYPTGTLVVRRDA